MNHRFRGMTSDGPTTQTTLGCAIGSFVVCPLMGGVHGMAAGPVAAWQHVYRLALEQAQAVLKPSRLERLETVCLN